MKGMCPYCGNPINWMKPIKLDEKTKTVWFVAECWDGKYGREKRHHFLVKKENMLVAELDDIDFK